VDEAGREIGEQRLEPQPLAVRDVHQHDAALVVCLRRGGLDAHQPQGPRGRLQPRRQRACLVVERRPEDAQRGRPPGGTLRSLYCRAPEPQRVAPVRFTERMAPPVEGQIRHRG
jgi:hypothetical protein